MLEPTQIEPVAPAGNEGSGDPAFDAALAEAAAAAPVAETPAVEAPVEAPAAAPPAETPDFTLVTLENGQREMTLPTGQVYRGKDDAELYGQLAKAQIAASRRITELSKPAEPVAPAAPAAPEVIDPTALAIADLMAPAFGVKSGAELVAAFAEQQRVANAQQEYMAAQATNYEAQKFFAANPDFPKTDADTAKIDNFLQANNIPFNANTAEMVYHTLKAKGEITPISTAPRAAAPVNTMPPPPTGTAPANTGAGAPTETDLWSMTPDQLEALMISAAPQ